MHMYRRHRRRFIYMLFPIAALLLVFTNCDSNYSISLLSKSNQGSDSSGYGYGGKPIIIYNRYLPDFSCDSSPTYLERLIFSNTELRFLENNQLQCATNSQPGDQTLIDKSPLQSEIISYNTAMFMKSDSDVDGIPNKLAEVWCRDELDPNIDVLAYYDRAQTQAYAKIFYRDPNQKNIVQLINEFPASRLISEHIINYEAENLKLRIDRDNLGPVAATFWGEISVDDKSNSFVHQGKVFCRLGGSLDPRIWPMLKINAARSLYSLYDNNLGALIYSIMDQDFHTKLIQWRPTGLSFSQSQSGLGQTSALVSSEDLGGHIDVTENFKISPSGKLIFRATTQLSGSIRKKLFSLDILSKKLSPLSALETIGMASLVITQRLIR